MFLWSTRIGLIKRLNIVSRFPILVNQMWSRGTSSPSRRPWRRGRNSIQDCLYSYDDEADLFLSGRHGASVEEMAREVNKAKEQLDKAEKALKQMSSLNKVGWQILNHLSAAILTKLRWVRRPSKPRYLFVFRVGKTLGGILLSVANTSFKCIFLIVDTMARFYLIMFIVRWPCGSVLFFFDPCHY